MNIKTRRWIGIVSLLVIIGLLSIGVFTFDPSNIGVETVVIGGEVQTSSQLLLPNTLLVPLVVLFTSAFLLVGRDNSLFHRARILPAIGKRSYSIFVWHQIILALYRYSFSSTVTVWFVVAFIIILCVLSEVSFKYIESRITVKHSIATVVCACLICVFSGYIYIQSGTVRDVPELGISVSNTHRGMHAEYCDRIHKYNQDFEDSNKLKILVIGNSFARDFGNILLESEYSEYIDLSYSSSCNERLVDRIKQADRIFVFNSKDSVPDVLWDNVKSKDIVYGIGTKNFGTLNGQIYFNRFKTNYFDQTVPLDSKYKAANEQLSKQWGDHYIDMISVVMLNDQIRVFTDTNMYISQDTRHLTQAGAQYYSRILNLAELLY